MTERCRRPIKREVIETFVVKWMAPNGDATAAIVCGRCGETFYTSLANRDLATVRGMLVLCLPCADRIAEEDDEVEVRGRVRDGKIVPSR